MIFKDLNIQLSWNDCFIIDETMIQIGNDDAWFWVAQNHSTDKSLVFIFQDIETCLLESLSH